MNELTVDNDEWIECCAMVLPMDVEILHIDQILVAVNKPVGLPVLPDGWQKDAPYLFKLLQERHGRLWIVHRLDKVTSGVLVLARTSEAHRILSVQFEKHEVRKVYHAIAVGTPDWDEKTARHRLTLDVGHKHRTVVDHRTGKISETLFRIQQRYVAHALVEARPVTGRTHQVRVHLSALGHPLLGDVLYGAPPTQLIPRPALHASSLTLTHPETGQPVTFYASYPQDFQDALAALKAGVSQRRA